jgi:uracil-DNA glycosylase
MIRELIPYGWRDALLSKVPSTVFDKLDAFLQDEYAQHTVYPAVENIFNAINGICPDEVKVVILGQDPYHEPGQAHGLSFSVQDGTPLPPSLKNIYWELYNDLGINRKSGCLEDWKEQGVLLLNTVLTVREHEANSHKNIGWEEVTKAILEIVMEVKKDTVFLLWGNQAYNTYMEAYKMFTYHGYPTWIHVIRSAHPSPLSARRGFIGSHPFSATNDILQQCKVIPINW